MREPETAERRVEVGVAEARATILDAVRPLGSEVVDLLGACGRILAEEIRPERWIPPRDCSAMDGYAVRTADLGSPPVELRVVEEIAAGHESRHKLEPGEVARILTGAPMPPGADAVVIQEWTERRGSSLRVLRGVEPGANVRRAGSDVRPGMRIARPGDRLGSAHLGMLAALGRTRVTVVERPRVAILATGDELVEPDRLADDGTIVSSNSYTLAAALHELGLEPIYLGIAPDDPETIAARLQQAVRFDAVLSTGGVSVGDRDWIKTLLAELGGEMHLWRVRMKPGAPLAFTRLDGCLLFGLPGNPVSAQISFEIFARPALLRMMGHDRIHRPVDTAVLDEDLVKSAGRMHFVRVTLEEREGVWHACTTGDQSSGVLLSMMRADALALLPEAETRIPAGTVVKLLRLDRDDRRREPGF